MDNTKNNYDEILRKFDNELVKTIQNDVLSACLDTVWEQAYQEGYRDGQIEIFDEQIAKVRAHLERKLGRKLAPMEELNYVCFG